MDQFVTLSCISNPLGGPLIGTTLWTGVPFRDVLARPGPAAGARYAHIHSADGFDEEVDLELVNGDPRIVLAYAWDGQPLPRQHGFPLRIFIPDRYGMKQPKWVTGVTLAAESIPGYWVVARLGREGRGQDHLRDRHGGGQVPCPSRRTDLRACRGDRPTPAQRASPRSRSR